MKTKSIYEYIWLGTSIRYLQDARAGVQVHGNFMILANIDELLSNLEEFDLHTTSKAADALKAYREKMAGKGEDYRLTTEEASEISKIMTELRKIIDAESTEKYIYLVTPKRIWVEKLLDDVSSLMRPNAYEKMTKIAQYDLKEAGLCIAFERPTAAAYHLLRATEEVLRQYYRYSIKRKRIGHIMWKNILDELTSRKKIAKPLLARLDNIREQYRNPTDHPEMIYDIEEVQDLFMVCIEVIHKMLQEMKLI